MTVTAAPVVIVGGGFSGLLTAIHLLRADRDVAVRLIERAPQFGRGRAYATRDPGHLLNVRAANMSAFPDQPAHFVDWLGGGPGAGEWFAGRGRYGDYLQDLLRRTLAAQSGRLLLEQDEAVRVRRVRRGFAVDLALGRSIEAGAVVLAMGSLPPATLRGVSREAARSPNYVADPWRVDLRSLPEGRLLLIGTGLTMIDVALSLEAGRRRFTALSRRGLLPRPHASAPASLAPAGLPARPTAVLRLLRRHAEAVGWRAAVDSIRPQTAELWKSWPDAERRRFLRHLRPWWDAHRHRMAPAAGARIAELQDTGRLGVRAGRIETLQAAPGGFEALIRPRGVARSERLQVAAVVDCTGISGELAQDPSGLLPSLEAQGLISGDALGLGLATDDRQRLLDPAGQVAGGLYAVGPLCRGTAWEAIAVPDLRNQTARLASTVIRDLKAGARAAVSQAGPASSLELEHDV
ncbi:FAD/NAD(P)-binding protein [Phenylobacterium sp. LjRoot219]|uniref:FAD/NAD(P)-binding protein n=1 Tax=Phenylobacterium sp. LjRoot219 TaxID=3342283 RepID=UPI003ECD91FB